MASVATFDDTMADIIYELDDREIYNDVRSELKYIETETIVDEKEDSEYAWTSDLLRAYLDPGESKQRTSNVYTGDTALSWKITSPRASTGPPDYDDYSNYTVTKISSDSSSCTLSFKNTGSIFAHIFANVGYRYLYSYTPEVTHDESELRTLMVRATDPTSIKKYARRVMNLAWPMGATQEQTQSLVNSYATRYSEPVARVRMTLKGSDDTKRVQMLTRKISEMITVVSSDLGLNSDFFINKIDFRDDPHELVELVWMLEWARDTETIGVFMIDTDSIDGPKLIG